MGRAVRMSLVVSTWTPSLPYQNKGKGQAAIIFFILLTISCSIMNEVLAFMLKEHGAMGRAVKVGSVVS